MRGRFGFGFQSYRGALFCPLSIFRKKTMLCVESESDPSGEIILESHHYENVINHALALDEKLLKMIKKYSKLTDIRLMIFKFDFTYYVKSNLKIISQLTVLFYHLQ